LTGAARRVRELTYAIREFCPLARELEKKGHRVIYMNMGDPARWGFDVPRHVKEALCRAVGEGHNYYSPSQGDEELRKAIAEKERAWNSVEVSPDDVYITFGVSEAIFIALAALLNPGDEVLLPDPAYPLYVTYARLLEAKPRFYPCREETGWLPDISRIARSIGPRTRAIVVINPNNPTGAVYSENNLREILDVAAERGLVVISDEIYDGLVLEGSFTSVASVAKDVPVIGLNGLSKTFMMTGWRVGYLYLKLPDGYDWLRDAIRRLALSRLGVATPVQKAAITALRGPLDHLERFRSELRKRRDLLLKLLDETGYFSVVKPRGAFYAFPRIEVRGPWKSDKEFVRELLLQAKVLVVHGSGLGKRGAWHIRLVYLPPPEVIGEAITRIGRFVRRCLGRKAAVGRL